MYPVPIGSGLGEIRGLTFLRREQFNELCTSIALECGIRQWGDGVAEYRVYTVDGAGHFIGFAPLVCATDAEAIDQAKRLVVIHAKPPNAGRTLLP
jgi:hypothetical protein